jgi:hypothetical protein
MPSSSSPRPGERSAEGRLRGPNDQPASAPQATPPDPPNPQTPLNPHNTNFAAPASDTSPGAMSGGAVSGGTGSASNPCLPGEAASKAKAVSGDTASAPCPQDASPTNSPQPAQHELRRSDPSQAHPHRPIAPSTGAPASREGLANERHLLAEHAPT